MALQKSARKLRVADPHAELPIKNHKYVKNCTELYLANKRIDKIANFDAFVNLEVLWINDNQLQHLDGLDTCFRLKQVYAQNNCISTLDGSSLPHFKFLQELRLYNNKLKDLQGTLNVLSRLSRLRDLDLFGNAIVEEENYRLQVIRALPSLDVLDRHVVTDQERAKASKLKLHAEEDGGGHKLRQQKKQNPIVSSSQALSGTVKILFKEVAATKRLQQKEAQEAAEREQQDRTRRQQTFSTTYRRSVNNNRTDEVPGLDDWEVLALKKHFRSLEDAQQSGLSNEKFGDLVLYLRTRGYAVLSDGCTLEGKSSDMGLLEKYFPGSSSIQWKELIQLFMSSRLRCEVLTEDELRQQASMCFDKCAAMQRRLQALDPSDARCANLTKESLELSQQGYHLQTLADGDSSSSRSKSSRVPSSADNKTIWEPATGSTPRTRFYMTAFSRERASSPRDCSSKFSELKAEHEHVTEALAGKYKIRQKDFTKYLLKQSPHTTNIVRRTYLL